MVFLGVIIFSLIFLKAIPPRCVLNVALRSLDFIRPKFETSYAFSYPRISTGFHCSSKMGCPPLSLVVGYFHQTLRLVG